VPLSAIEYLSIKQTRVLVDEALISSIIDGLYWISTVNSVLAFKIDLTEHRKLEKDSRRGSIAHYRERAKEVGMKDYLTKPLDLDALKKIIEQL
jgi:hypothetical protein